jgi:membrane dipeptidase
LNSDPQEYVPIIDLHNDLPVDVAQRRLNSERNVLNNSHLQELKRGGIGGFNGIAFVEPEYKPFRALNRAMKIVDSLFEDLEETEDFIFVRSGSDFRRAFDDGGKIVFILGSEGGEFIETDLSILRNFYRLGLRSFGLVWDERNLIGDGYSQANTRNGGSGLSEFGYKVVEECNRMGIIIDGAHINPNGLSDILERSKKPIMVSHGSTLCHPGSSRPISDEHLKLVAKGGGVSGIFALNVKNSIPDVDSFLDNVEYAIKVAGIDHVGLGFDFFPGSEERFRLIQKKYPDITDCQGLKNASESQNAIRGLRRRGFKEEDIKKVASGNFLRVLTDVTG